MKRTDLAKLRERYLSRQQQRAEDERWWKPQIGGRYKIRILPPPQSSEFFFMEYGVHYLSDNPEVGAITCNRLTANQRCYACEVVRGFWRAGDDSSKKLAKELNARRRYISNIVLLTDAESAKIPRLWTYGPTVWDQIVELAVGSEGNMVALDDPKQGYNLTVTVRQKRTEVGVFPQYIITPDLKPSPLPDPSVLNNLHDFVAIITARLKTYDEVRAIMEGTAEPDEPENDGHDAPAVAEEPVSAVAPDEVQEEVVDDTESAPTPAPTQSAKPPGASSAADLVARARKALAARRGGA